MSRVHVTRGVNPQLVKNSKDLEFWTSVPVDNEFSSPKQIRYSGVLGKLLVSAIPTSWTMHVRNADLSFHSKYYQAGYSSGCIDSDVSYLYQAGTASLGKFNLYAPHDAPLLTRSIASIRMIDASGDPDYLYVTSNNGTDHHGFRQVKKSTMAVTASALADGSGDGQFDDPLGIFYYNSEVFVADYDNSRISVWTKSGETLTYARKYDLGYKPMDLCFDGTNWYVQSATTLYKYDNVFTDGTKTSVANVGYSITLIPDQGDGNGATIAFTDTTNHHIGRRKCSDLSTATADVGSSGDGSSSLFDPTFTTSVATRVTYTFDDGFSYTTASDTSHALSWNGFAGYSFRSAGPHRCVVRVEGGLGLVTAIDCSNDYVTVAKNIEKLTRLTSLTTYGNNFPLNFNTLPKTITSIYALNNNLAYGDIGNLPRVATSIRISGCVLLAGSVSDLPTSTATAWLYYDTSVVAGSIAALVNLQDIRVYNMGWTSGNVDTVLLSASDAVWLNADHFSYSAPSLQIGGTNAAPGGSAGADTTDPLVTPGAGNSNSDWQWDGDRSAHKALSGKAAVWYLTHLATHTWSCTYS